MQRIYGKNDMKEKEYYELREPSRPSTDRHPDLYKKAEAKTGKQFTIPSSSHMIEKEPVPASPVYTPPPSQPHPQPMRNMRLRSPYYQEPEPQQQYPSDVFTSPRNLHCIVIADHIVDCPICSRFYRNYSPIYNVIIFILVVVLMIMIIRMNRPYPGPTISAPAPSPSIHHHRPAAAAVASAPPPVSSFL